ncbi:MAG TPA: M50 family metallopeptidase [Candidatus Obscuribacterales bacterium]
MMTSELSGTFSSKSRAGVIFLLVLASFILPHIPVLSLITAPISSFTTTIHEMGHAIACLLTGGQVSGMSIVNDGEGHGGLTYCQGGWPLIYAQAGYITTALVGCAMIWVGQYPRLSKGVLVAIGGAFAVAGSTFMFDTILHGQIMSGLGSMFIALAIGAGIIFVALKLNFYWANLLLLFLGVQTALNAVNDDGVLLMQAFGMFGNTWSDASNMQNMTAIPAAFWAVAWTGFAVVLLFFTLKASLKKS